MDLAQLPPIEVDYEKVQKVWRIPESGALASPQMSGQHWSIYSLVFKFSLTKYIEEPYDGRLSRTVL
jgi:hypothetical protein